MQRPFLRTIALAACIAAAGPLAAQVTAASGTIMLRQPDGTAVPAVGATIDIHRTDIRGQFTLRSNRNGRYHHAGVPSAGTYTIAVSAPGAAAAFRSGVRFHQVSVQNFELQPGDGARLTLVQIRERQAAANPPRN